MKTYEIRERWGKLYGRKVHINYDVIINGHYVTCYLEYEHALQKIANSLRGYPNE